MPVTVGVIDPAANFEQLREFSQTVWPGTRDESYWRWLVNGGRLVCVAAMDDGRKIRALVLALRRSYRVGERLVECLETFDWYCLPADMGSGLGVFVMRHLLRLGHPVVALGALPEAEHHLVRLGFTRLGHAEERWIPLERAALMRRGRSLGFAILGAGYSQLRLAYGSRKRTEEIEDSTDDEASSENGIAGADETLTEWLRTSPPSVGEYWTSRLPVPHQNAYCLLRMWWEDDVPFGEILDLRTDHVVGAKARLIDQAIQELRARRCAALRCVTTDQGMLTALALRAFRLSATPSVLVFWPPRANYAVPSLLVNGSRGDGLFARF